MKEGYSMVADLVARRGNGAAVDGADDSVGVASPFG